MVSWSPLKQRRNSEKDRPALPTRAVLVRQPVLLACGWGKPATFVPIEGADPLEMDEAAAEIRSIAEQPRRDRDAG